MEKYPVISVVIPAYNESARIGVNLDRINEYFKQKKVDYEVLVVNDGSTDDTAEVVKRYHRHNPRIQLLSYEKNKGKGYAVKYGMERSRGEYKLFTDSDGSVSIYHLDMFLPYIENSESDIVIGSIEIGGHIVEEHSAKYRRFLGSLSKLLIRALATPGIYDSQRGFKLFSQQAAKDVFSRQTIDRWGFDVELLVIARAHGYRITELPVTWINPAGSLVDADRLAFIRTFKELLEIVMKSMMGYYRPSRSRFKFLHRSSKSLLLEE